MYVYIYLFLERKERKEKEKEKNSNKLPLAWPQLGAWPATQACALTGIELVTFWFMG